MKRPASEATGAVNAVYHSNCRKTWENVLFSVQAAAFSCLPAPDVVLQSRIQGFHAQAKFYTMLYHLMPLYKLIIHKEPFHFPDGVSVCDSLEHTEPEKTESGEWNMQHVY